MSVPDLWYRSSPFAHLCFLVSEALDPRVRPARPGSASTPVRARIGWLERLDQWAWRARLREREGYLAEATDLADLEARMRDLDRAMRGRYY